MTKIIFRLTPVCRSTSVRRHKGMIILAIKHACRQARADCGRQGFPVRMPARQSKSGGARPGGHVTVENKL